MQKCYFACRRYEANERLPEFFKADAWIYDGDCDDCTACFIVTTSSQTPAPNLLSNNPHLPIPHTVASSDDLYWMHQNLDV